MDSATLRKQLELAGKSDEPYYEFQDIGNALEHKKVEASADLIETILRYMEDYPDHDYGAPGYLVHFMETASRSVLLPALLASVQRRPTPDTIGMLFSFVRQEKDARERARLLSLFEACATHPLARANAEGDRVAFYMESLVENDAGKTKKKKGK